MDILHLNDKTYPVRPLYIDGGWVKIGGEKLANMLFTDDSHSVYASDYAQFIDELIYFYVPDNMLGEPSKILIKYINENAK